ncbi:MAG: nucleotide sugar dehydrogenase [Candidatus Limnocylindria bacterium]
MTRVSIFGLGYVGSVSAACLADSGHTVVGVDVSPEKIEAVAAGRSPIVEEGLDELMARGVDSGRIRTTTDVVDAITATDVSLICVGTPSNPNGSLDLSAVERVAENIGAALATKRDDHVVVVRSTMLPGSTEERVIPALERGAGRALGQGYTVCYNPEFLREGSSIRDFYHPPFTVIGGEDEAAAAAVADLYSATSAPVAIVATREAEMLKYVSNAFHALKIAFANEIGLLCKSEGIDSHKVMNLFGQDDKLNISRAYLRPGYAFGGSCLPKDLRALVHHSQRRDLASPILEAIIPSNNAHVDAAFDMIRATGAKRIGVLGLSFKAGTDDLRESPLVTLVERLIGKGYDVRVLDPNVSFASLHGANRAYIEREVPHVLSLMVDDLDALVSHAEVLVVGHGSPDFAAVMEKRRDDQKIIDLVRLPAADIDLEGYEGIAW